MNVLTPFPLINAVLTKQQKGNIYSFPGGELILHKACFSYLKVFENFNPETFVNFVIKNKNLPQYFHIYDPPASIIEKIGHDERVGSKVRKRIQLRFLNQTIDEPSILKMDKEIEIDIQPITEENFDKLAEFNLDLSNKFYNSKEDFLTNGYGTLAIIDNKPVSICYAACVANNIAEIDVATLPEYQGKGLAKRVTIAFIKQSIKNNIVSNWDCFEENTPSLKTADATGFSTLKNYTFLSVFIKDKI